jgi:hypothetical protein
MLRLYPRAYRREFDGEMRSVFTLAAGEAYRRGALSLFQLCWRELCSLPVAIVHEHWRDARRNGEDTTMKEWPENRAAREDLQGPLGAAPGPRTDRPGSWGGTLAGLIPFLYMGLWSISLASLASPPPRWQLAACVGALVAGYVVMLVGLGVGWAQSFPRWSYAYLLMVPLFSVYVSVGAMSAIWPYAYPLCVPLIGPAIPLGLVAAVVVAVTRSWEPLVRLFTHIWEDWTRLSFALYALVPWVVWLAFDEIEDRYVLPFMIALTLILTGGALAYLRSTRALQRVTALLTATVLARVVATTGTKVYWNTHPQPWMTGSPVPWHGIARASASAVLLLLAFLFAPALLGLLRRWLSAPRAA